VSESNRTTSNAHGMQVAKAMQNKDFTGLCFVNLVDFDMKYGHRNDVAGYAAAATEFDRFLPSFIGDMRDDDVLIITADHGCDPATPSTDHSREYTPMLIYGKHIKSGVNLGVRGSFADIGATVLEYFGVDKQGTSGKSFLGLVKQ
ncbi:MAG: phosphopentomutase, partial [Clostridiales bacterium]|nr:phosphopentomutase [Clostridiales bacterium]